MFNKRRIAIPTAPCHNATMRDDDAAAVAHTGYPLDNDDRMLDTSRDAATGDDDAVEFMERVFGYSD